MKTVLSHLALVALVIGISSGFVNKPYTTELTTGHDVLNASPAGGAYLVFAGRHGGNIKLSELQKETQLGVDGCARGSRIFSFALEINDRNGIRTMQGTSNMLTKEMHVALKRLSVGDSFEFKSIKAWLPNGKDTDVSARKFVIVSENTPST